MAAANMTSRSIRWKPVLSPRLASSPTPKDELLPTLGATVSLFNRAFTASVDVATRLTEQAEQAEQTINRIN